MLAFSTEEGAVLVDCGGDVLRRARQSGIEVDRIRAVILTHEHPDHVGGWPVLLEKLWLHGRSEPIKVLGPESALRQARSCFEVFNTSNWKGLPERQWEPVPLEDGQEFFELGVLRFTGTPGDHGVPVMAFRADNVETGASVCYSADTKPSERVARLASGCDILVHEANGVNPVHSTAEDAARVAREAGCGKLILVHLPAGMTESDLGEARAIFPATYLGEELARFPF
jgi:ribonuclease Z